jgi:hypothetical protein
VLEQESKIVKSMVQILLSSNVNSAALLLNGFAGEILIFVNLAIKSKLMGIMFQRNQRKSFLSVKEQPIVHSKYNIQKMGKSMH